MIQQENPTYFVYVKHKVDGNSLYEFETKEKMNSWFASLGSIRNISSIQIIAGFTLEKRNSLLL